MSTETANPFLIWAPSDKPLVIHLDHGVMDRLNVETMRGFGVTRRRGTETGGVLLGRINRRAAKPVVSILDFEVVPCEYASGPSYLLSANDQARFRETIARWQPSLDRDTYAVGYFRSHTRDGFALDETDAAIFREFFPDPLDVALLIKPFATRAATAGFFLKDKGVLATASTPQEFKLETPARAEKETEPVTGQPAPAAAAPTAVLKVFPPPSPAPRPRLVTPETQGEHEMFSGPPPSRWPRRIGWAAFCLALLGFGGACGYEYAGRVLLQQKPGAGRAVRGGLPNSDMYAIQLEAANAGSSVMLKWDRDSAPIQAALRGTLTVTEGGNSKEVKLAFAELRNGTAMYPVAAREIRFRMELFFADNRSFVESAVYVQPAARQAASSGAQP